MSRKITSVILSLILSGSLNAGDGKHPQLRYISFDAGLNISGISSSLNYDSHRKNFGASVNLSGNFSFTDSWSVEAALAFEQKGAVDNIYDINTNLNYLALPVYMKWITGKDPRLFIITGFYGSWLINAIKRGKQYAGGEVTRVNENVSSDFYEYDYGIILGTGMMVRLYDDFDFILSLRGSAGLPGIVRQTGLKSRNYHFNISLGYVYYIGFR